MAVAVFGVMNTMVGVSLTESVGVFSSVGVGDLKPIKVGVDVNVSVSFTGVTDGIGVYVFVDVKTGVGVATGPKDNPPTEQAKDSMAQVRMMNVFLMVLYPALEWGILLMVRSTCKAQAWQLP